MAEDQWYHGQWDVESNQPHGTGVLATKDTLYEGQFKRGKPHGIGRTIDESSIYVGEHREGMKDGVGQQQTKTYINFQ